MDKWEQVKRDLKVLGEERNFALAKRE